MDGFEVLEKVKTDEALKNIPVLILTNSNRCKKVEKGMEIGAVDYILKSQMSIDGVVDKVRKYIGE